MNGLQLCHKWASIKMVSSYPFRIESIHTLLMGWIDSIKGMDRLNSKGMDRLKTSLTVHTVLIWNNKKGSVDNITEVVFVFKCFYDLKTSKYADQSAWFSKCVFQKDIKFSNLLIFSQKYVYHISADNFHPWIFSCFRFIMLKLSF